MAFGRAIRSGWAKIVRASMLRAQLGWGRRQRIFAITVIATELLLGVVNYAGNYPQLAIIFFWCAGVLAAILLGEWLRRRLIFGLVAAVVALWGIIHTIHVLPLLR